MSYQIVFFDIDGTLVDERKEIPQDTVDAVRELQRNGVETVIATGRAPYFFAPLAEKLGIDSYISLNGAYVVCRGKPIFTREIPRESVAALVNHAARYEHCLVFQGHSAFYANDASHPYMIESVSSLRVGLPGHDPDYWRTESIYQMFLHCEAGEEHLYEGAVPGLKYIRWHDKAMDVIPDDRSKAQGIQAFLSYLNLTPRQAIAFGDGLNDKEMLSLVGLGIAMGNCHEELKPFADYVTTAVDAGGIRNGLRYAGIIG